ncbi:MAG TPA: glycosyltransferase [Tepidisphaeraceae bacterium]|nr:glycosyltransferase [Tepidisphaeraceae bacterium]
MKSEIAAASPRVGVVAIGRNEGERLRACLVSARRDCSSVVYVDSGSSDESVALARSLGCHVVELDLATPFTAARARNEGFAFLKQIDSDVQFVQFVDGDCEIVVGWIAKATAELAARSRAAIVCGRRRERFPDASVYNRLCDMEWNTPIGQAKACGGDALVRVSAFEEVGGYDGSVIAGEEPEMCVRLRERGWTIHRIDAEMTLHDAAMTRASQWWRRNVRGGHAYAQGFAMHGAPPENCYRRQLRSIAFWGFAPLIATAVMIVALLIARPMWVWVGFFPMLGYAALAAKSGFWRFRRGDRAKDAAMYGVAVTLAKFPQAVGVRKFRRAQKRGIRNTIIEYKGPAHPRSVQGQQS